MYPSSESPSNKFPPRGRTPVPTNAYLRERLAESRVQSSHVLNSSRTTSERGRDDHIFDDDGPSPSAFTSSPVRAHTRRSSDTLKGGLGVREMERRMDRLSKENFSLKLEIHHRDEALAKLRIKVQQMAEQMQRVATLEATNKELFEVNEELCKELEKRDGALKDAVEMINGLEDQNTQLLSQTSLFSRPATSQADTGYCSAASNPGGPRSRSSSMEFKSVAGSVPAQTLGLQSPKTSQSALGPGSDAEGQQSKLVPPSASDRKRTSTALRQLYLTGEESIRTIRNRNSFLSILSSKAPDNDSALPTSPPSPALSDVSELDSTFFGQRSEGPPRDVPPYEENGTTLFTTASTTTPRPYVYREASLASPVLDSSRSFDELHLEGSGCRSNSPHRSPRLHHLRRGSVPDESREQPYAPIYSSPLRSPQVLPQPHHRNRSKSDSISPGSPRPSTPQVQDVNTSPDSSSPLSYGGFPTGASINHGTPSRFIRPIPVAANLMFDGEGIEDFQCQSPSLHHAASTSVPHSQRKRSLSSGTDTMSKVSPALIRNHTMSSVPNSPQGHVFPNLYNHRSPPQMRTGPQKVRHPLSQNTAYVPYRPASRNGPSNPTQISQFSPSISSSPLQSSTLSSGPLTPSSDTVPPTHPPPRHTPTPLGGRKLSFIPNNKATPSDISSPTTLGEGGDRGDRMSSVSGRSYEVEAVEPPVSAMTWVHPSQETPPRSESRLGSRLGSKGRSPSVDGSGKRRWPWKRG